ncbi:MAG: late competence development ComFB family protein [Lachnospiraceae bacterium]|nr:late competence development ComFB family protein [Lachnospiraceae bacterium]
MGYKLVNVMEDRVFRAVGDTLPQLGYCDCERCKSDVAAYTLSRIKPYYIVASENEIISSTTYIDSSYDTEILQTIVQAADVVSAKPNHD